MLLNISCLSNESLTGLFGLFGVISGAVISIVGTIIIQWLKERPNKALERQRSSMLKEMLNGNNNKWRKISTLSSVIGASEEETKRILIKIKARGSETEKDVWALIKYRPLPSTK